jgi:deoxyribose-phosphate aldolase
MPVIPEETEKNKGKKEYGDEIKQFRILCGKDRNEEGNNMALTPKDIAAMLDHSTLQPWLTEDDIRRGCEVALKYETASVCARPCDVPILSEMLKGSPVKVCTVIGFPHGAHQTAIKLAEAKQALAEGCEELDMVINIGKLKHGDAGYVEEEIRQLAEAAHAAGAILKVILETCYLTEEEKILACRLSEKAGADFVKTSTGYGSAGCTIEDLKLMRANVSEKIRIKGSGGIRDLDTVLSARAVGASRCGVSATEKIMAEAEKRYAEGTLKEIDTLREMGGGY